MEIYCGTTKNNTMASTAILKLQLQLLYNNYIIVHFQHFLKKMFVEGGKKYPFFYPCIIMYINT